ncbi:unnamed protein product, partial [Hapterophycus canaliculatus]
AVYGVARVLQESGDHTASRELLLFLGERSQELLRKFTPPPPSSSSSPGSASAESNPTNDGHDPSFHHRRRRLCFPLSTGHGAPGVGGRSGGGGGGISGSLVLPAAPAEVMWRVARASMAAKDWPMAILALRGLAASYAPGGEETRAAATAPHGAPSPPASLSPDCSGPGRARALRALAFCQIQRGLYRDALETVRVGLGGGAAHGAGAAGGEAAEVDDAAMLMLRAEALV